MKKVVIYQPSRTALGILFLGSGIAALFLILVLLIQPIEIEWITELLMTLAIIGTSFACFKSKNWREWKYFVVDKNGISFPNETPQTEDTYWLTVPWSCVEDCKVEPLFHNQEGLSVQLRISQVQLTTFFVNDSKDHLLISRSASKPHLYKVTFRSNFSNSVQGLKQNIEELRTEAHENKSNPIRGSDYPTIHHMNTKGFYPQA